MVGQATLHALALRAERERVRPLVPQHLSIDTYDGQAWLGVVPFTMWGVRPYLTPPVPGLNSFHELNVRTYVHYEGVPGVLFLSMEINSPVAKWGGRQFFFLPYYNAEMSLAEDQRTITYASRRTSTDAPAARLRRRLEPRRKSPRSPTPTLLSSSSQNATASTRS